MPRPTDSTHARETDGPLRRPAGGPLLGRIDIHSHLLYGIDDGCVDLQQSLTCVAMLKAQGFVGTVCTPHLWPDLYPLNRPAAIKQWVERLRGEISDAGYDYRIWPGGELRIFDGAIAWMQEHGVPTLGDTRCVLTDYWGGQWSNTIDETFRWLIDEGYQPILAHPERIRMPSPELEKRLDAVRAMGVWLQGNTRCITGQEGLTAKERLKQFIEEDRYHLLALDMHQPETLGSRFDGLAKLEDLLGAERVELLCAKRPREMGLTI